MNNNVFNIVNKKYTLHAYEQVIVPDNQIVYALNVEDGEGRKGIINLVIEFNREQAKTKRDLLILYRHIGTLERIITSILSTIKVADSNTGIGIALPISLIDKLVDDYTKENNLETPTKYMIDNGGNTLWHK